MAPRPHKTQFAYSGLISCGECGARITAEEKWQTVCTSCKTKFTSTNSNICPNCGTKTEDMQGPKLDIISTITVQKEKIQIVLREVLKLKIWKHKLIFCLER